MDIDEYFMRKALDLAKKGYGTTSPNPLVGAVVVKGNTVVAEGYHERPGKPHAEANALEKAGKKACGGTLYVNLEPCCYYGRTPPCVEKIVEAGIQRVVCSIEDPNPQVSGKGVLFLKNAGVKVTTGVLEKESRKLNEAFIKYIKSGLPFIINKYAMSLDGKIATKTGKSQWISSDTSRNYVHKIRQGVDAVLVGIGTVLKDNPRLTCRHGENIAKQPIRIVVDSRLRITSDFNVISDGEAETLIVTTEFADNSSIKELEKYGAEVVLAPKDKNGRVNLSWLLRYLGERKYCSVLVEGGSQLTAAMVEDRLIDKFLVFVAPKIIGGTEAASPVEGEGISQIGEALELEDIEYRQIENDILIEGYSYNK